MSLAWYNSDVSWLMEFLVFKYSHIVKLDFDIPMTEAGHGDLREALHQETGLAVWVISLDAIHYTPLHSTTSTIFESLS